MKWYSKYLLAYEKTFAEVPPTIVEEVNRNITKLQSEQPLVTVSIIGYNEEKHLLACLWSLSEMQCKYPVEIIGVDNESKDRTAEIFQACGVPYYTETQHVSPASADSAMQKVNIISILTPILCILQNM